ncbi:PAS and ANTAR domain-containing protein [Isoptericola sp. NPDC057191]|uniref:PAS and ANTAR domain-containing protein n=1 Tax=Isoptericola sp. NPDC057191 TaxID=3346041 RepID=UPI003643517F
MDTDRAATEGTPGTTPKSAPGSMMRPPLQEPLDSPLVDRALEIEDRQPAGSFRCVLPDETWWWSDETYWIHGFEPGDVVPTTALVLAHKHPEDRERVRRILAGARRTRTPFASLHRIMDARGRERTVVLMGQVEHLPDDPSREALCGFVTDVTDQVGDRARRDASQQVAAATQSRETIDQAKGALALLYGLTSDEAFAALRTASNVRNVKLRDLAALVVEVARRDGAEAHRQLGPVLGIPRATPHGTR